MRTIILTLLLIPTILFASKPNPNEINWVSFEKAVELNKQNPKPIIVDVYTDWCKFCKIMDKKTYTNPLIIEYINKNFYAVKFNAERKEPLLFKGQTFKFVPQGRGYHEFAVGMLKGKLSYPSTVFFNKDVQIVDAVPGYLKTPLMEKLLNFMGEEVYLKQEWDVFEKNFKTKSL